jgi:hypothetical protein
MREIGCEMIMPQSTKIPATTMNIHIPALPTRINQR